MMSVDDCLVRVALMLKKNQWLAFTLGLWIFVYLLPGCWQFSTQIEPTSEAAQSQGSIVAGGSVVSNHSSPLGIGLSGIADYSTQLPFLDGFKTSRQWITQCDESDPNCKDKWDTQEFNLLDLDQKGWVKSLPAPEDAPQYTRVSTLLYRDIPNRYRSGKYIVLYEGEGKIEYYFAARKDEAASKPGRDIIDVDASKSDGILLSITATDPNKNGNYLRNIRVIHTDDQMLYQSGEIFNPLFLEKINKFSVLRFMDWMGTNGSTQKDWKDRPLPENVSYSYRGNVPVEIMVALANKLKAEPWFNMPHLATEDYWVKFAQKVKETLDPNLKVYVEYSNEVWNLGFPQSQYAFQQGKARWGENKSNAYMQWYGMKMAQMCDTWKSVFAEQKNRVICVMGTQRGWRGIEKPALECPEWVAEGNKPCYQHGIDAYAIAAYFGGILGSPDNVAQVESWLNNADGGFSQAFKQLKEGGALGGYKDNLPDVYQDFQYHFQAAKERNLQLVAYEGGQHIVGSQGVEFNERLTKFFWELNRRPEMYDLYTQLLQDWKKAGGTLFMHFVDIGQVSKWGSWGALEYVGQEGSPKYNALINFIDQTPCWWQGCTSNVTLLSPKNRQPA